MYSVRGQASVERHIALDSIHPPAGSASDGYSSAWDRLQSALKFPAVRAHRGPLVRTSETGKEVLEAAATDLLGGNATKAEDDLEHPPTHAFLGPYGALHGGLGALGQDSSSRPGSIRLGPREAAR